MTTLLAQVVRNTCVKMTDEATDCPVIIKCKIDFFWCYLIVYYLFTLVCKQPVGCCFQQEMLKFMPSVMSFQSRPVGQIEVVGGLILVLGPQVLHTCFKLFKCDPFHANLYRNPAYFHYWLPCCSSCPVQKPQVNRNK